VYVNDDGVRVGAGVRVAIGLGECIHVAMCRVVWWKCESVAGRGGRGGGGALRGSVVRFSRNEKWKRN
jgi:hypothetical protein